MRDIASHQTPPGPGHDLGRIPVLAPEADDAKETAAPSLVREVLRSPGRPVDAATRAFFEPRFGRDFGHVRVHTDERAGASARSVGAEAYNVGGHLVFGPQAFRPESEQGRRLIAHELAHVVQQPGAGPGAEAPLVNRISRTGERAEEEAEAASAQVLSGLAPSLAGVSEGGVLHRAPPGAQPAPAKVFYQEALDELAEEMKRAIPLSGRPFLKKLVELCEAIERGAVDDIKRALDEFVVIEVYNPSLSTPSSSLLYEMTTRMLLLGLDVEADKLRRRFNARQKEISSYLAKDYSQEIYTWEGLQKRLLELIPEPGMGPGLTALDTLILFLGQLVRERFSLDEEEIEKDQKKRAEQFDNYWVQRDRTVAVYAAELVRLMRETFAGIQSAFQVVLDQAVEDLAAGRGGDMLRHAKDRLENKLLPLIEPADKGRQIGGVSVETTRSEFKEGGGEHYDILSKTEAAQKKRSVKVQFYDAEQLPGMASEMSSDFAGVFLARRRQIALIEEIYGVQKDDKGDPTAETKENAAAGATLGAGGLRLHSDDDWRKFVVAKFEAREPTEGPEKALTAVMVLLEKYMRVFTTHTPYNIEDFGDNLLTKTFPRDLAGRLIHDCGVYGLRMAYILSLLRDHPKLKLRFRYVVMPLHVGLLITGDGLPTFLVNNDSITRYTAADVTALRAEWDQLDETGGKGKPAKPGTEARFSGELMADAFLSGADLPYKQADVVKATGTPAAMKAQLWGQYTGGVAPAADRLFGPSVKDPNSPNYQFYLRYLKLLELFKRHHNEALLPFWNVKAPAIWGANKDALTKALAELQNAAADKKASAQAAYDAAVKAYEDALDAEFKLVQQAAQPIIEEQVAIQTHIDAHPEVFAPGTEVKSADRVAAMFTAFGLSGPWWENTILDHLLDLQSGKRVEAPFEKPEQKLMPIN